jgi:hypothetical protein
MSIAPVAHKEIDSLCRSQNRQHLKWVGRSTARAGMLLNPGHGPRANGASKAQPVKFRLKTRPATGTLAYEWKTPASGEKCHGDLMKRRGKSRREKSRIKILRRQRHRASSERVRSEALHAKARKKRTGDWIQMAKLAELTPIRWERTATLRSSPGNENHVGQPSRTQGSKPWTWTAPHIAFPGVEEKYEHGRNRWTTKRNKSRRTTWTGNENLRKNLLRQRLNGRWDHRRPSGREDKNQDQF